MKRGFALITTTIIAALLLTLGTHFILSSISEVKIAEAHGEATRAYYVGEAATQILALELTTDESLQSAFVAGTLTEASSAREYTNLFKPGDRARVYAQSSAPGEAALIASGTTPFSSTNATRRTETALVRALGSAITDYTIFNGAREGDLEFQLNTEIDGGVVFSNDDIYIRSGSRVHARNGGRLHAHDEVIVSEGGVLAAPVREGVDTLQMPAVDFGSALATSWRNQATERLTPREFDALPAGSVLQGIIYLEGTPRDLQRDLTIRGLLVVNGNFEIEAPGHLRIEAPASGPSGLLVRGDLEIENSSYIEGLVYATDELEIEYDDDDTEGTLNVVIRGGLMGRIIELERDIDGPATITVIHDPGLLTRILDDDLILSSPLIEINHWEEQY